MIDYVLVMKMHIMDIPPGPGRDRLQSLIAMGALPPLCIFNGPWLAGGAVRRLAMGQDIIDADVDLFFSSIDSWSSASDVVAKVASHCYRTDRATTYRVPMNDEIQLVQVIKMKMYNNAGEVFKDFDFSVCQFATDGDKIVYADSALEDLKSDLLTKAPNGRRSNRGLIKRVLKYSRYGFKPDSKLMLSTLRRCFDTRSTLFASLSDADDFYDTEVDDEKKIWVELNGE